MGTGSFLRVKCGRGLLLTTHPLLVSRSWKSRSIPLPTLWATPGLSRDHFTLFVCPSSAELNVSTRNVALVTVYGWVCYTGWNFFIPTCIPDNHSYTVTSTKCRIDTVISSEYGHIVTRNMYRKEINILRKLCTKLALFTRLYRDARSTKHKQIKYSGRVLGTVSRKINVCAYMDPFLILFRATHSWFLSKHLDASFRVEQMYTQFQRTKFDLSRTFQSADGTWRVSVQPRVSKD